jgi:YjcZ-like protein
LTDHALLARAGMDVLNSIDVMRDVVAWKKRPRNLAVRLISRVTGESARLDTTFGSHTAESVAKLLNVVSGLRDSIAESDAVLAKAIAKLRAVQERAADQEGQLGAVGEQLDAMHTAFDRELAAVRSRVLKLEARQAIDLALSRLESRATAANFSLADLQRAADELWWGDLGTFLRSAGNSPVALEVRESLRLGWARVLRDRRSLAGTLELAPLLGAVPVLTETAQEELDLATLDPDWSSRPLTRAVVQRSSGAPDEEAEARSVPIVITVDRLGERLLDEAARATEIA